MYNLAGIENREAKFRTVISLSLQGRQFLFEGVCEGRILADKSGSNGFGYDPVFVPEGAIKSFAEMRMEEKNTFNHRRKAVDKMIQFLKDWKY